MTFLLAALGLLLAIEGLSLAAFPGAAKRAAAAIIEAPEGTLRMLGLVVAVAGASATAPVLVMLLAGFAPVFAGMAHLRRQQVRLELIAMSGRNRWFAISYLIAVAALVVALAVRSGVSGWGTVLGAAVGAGLALGVIAARYRQQRHADAAEAESSDQNDER